MVAMFAMCEGKVSNLIYYFFVILFLGMLQLDGCRLSVLLTFSYVIEKLEIFPA